MTMSAENWAAITQFRETSTDGNTKSEDSSNFLQGSLGTAALVQGHRHTEKLLIWKCAPIGH